MESLYFVVGFTVGSVVTQILLYLVKGVYVRMFSVPTPERAQEIIQTQALPFVIKDDAEEAKLEKEFLDKATNPDGSGGRNFSDSVDGLGR